MRTQTSATEYPTPIAAAAEALAFAEDRQNTVIRRCGSSDFVLAKRGDDFHAVDVGRQAFHHAHPDATPVQISQTINVLNKLIELGSTESGVANSLQGHPLYHYFERELPNMDVDSDVHIRVGLRPAIDSPSGYFCSLSTELLDLFVPAVAQHLRSRG